MASYQIPPPPSMSMKGDLCTNWKTFKQSWDYYVIATELTAKTKVIQAATLCSIMGQDCVKIMNTLTTLSDDDKKKPEEITKKLGEHFIPKKHELLERSRFLDCTQTEHESIDQFIVRLRVCAETCEYGDLEESLIRDKLCKSTKDRKTGERLINERPVASLSRCMEVLRAAEMSRTYKEQLASSNEIHFVKKVSKQTYVRKPQHGNRHQESSSSKRPCGYCGYEHSKGKSNCPAYGKTCRKCHKDNHFESVCKKTVHTVGGKSKFSKQKIHHVDQEEESDDSLFAMRRCNTMTSKDEFMVDIKFKDKLTSTYLVNRTQLDTGSTCSAMSISTLSKILHVDPGSVKLLPPGGRIKLYDNSHVTPLGKYVLTVSRGGDEHDITFDIIPKSPWPVIDGVSCVKFGWITMNQNDSMNNENILKEYEDVFKGLGCLEGEYHIDIDETVKPVQHAPRRVPVPLKEKLKEKIMKMEQDGIIAKVTKPTDWISSLVAVQKPNKLRICIDPRDLNTAIKRPKYQMPTVDEILPKLAKAKIFTVLDAKDGFHQVKLDDSGSYLTTFWTPFGRYRYLRLPQGISSAPEEYQRRQTEVLDGLTGVDVIADDILCYGCGNTEAEALVDHDRNLVNLLKRARSANLKFNKSKIKLRLTEVSYMGQLLTNHGLKPDPRKVSDVINMPIPEDKKAVQRLLGVCNYLSRFMPTLSKMCEPLRKLTEKDVEFMWESQQDNAFKVIKNSISSAPILKYYDVTEPVTVQCDASKSGLGATLLQNGQPITFASRSLTHAEQNYAQIEKECLAILFACCRFDQYLHGRDKVTVQSDHKPLVPIFLKPLHQAPKRLQRMLLRLQKYSLDIHYLPGPQMYISDMLSRAYQKVEGISKDSVSDYQIFQMTEHEKLYEEIAQINQMEYMRLSGTTYLQIKTCTSSDLVLQTLMSTVMSGWPDDRDQVPVSIREYWTCREDITAQDGVLYKGMKVIVPTVMRRNMMDKVHSSHQGVAACVRRARDVLFWPGMSAEITEMVTACSVCSEYQVRQQKEPLMTHKIPKTPWTKVGQDLFSYQGDNYLVTVDFYSDYFELDHLSDTTAATVVDATKAHFSRHGIADMVTDNGPQYTSQEFAEFTRQWEFNHTTSSPLYSQSNGKSESAVKIAKSLIKKAKRDTKDLYMTLLEWRNTPSKDGASPSQKLFSRRTRTTLPTSETLYHPQIVDDVAENIKLRRQKAKQLYDQHAKPLPELEVGEQIKLQPHNPKLPWSQGSCIAKVGPRSYLVQTKDGIYRRNRKFIRPDHSVSAPIDTTPNVDPPQDIHVPTVPNDEHIILEDNQPKADLVAGPQVSKPRKPQCNIDQPIDNTSTRTRSGRSVKTPSKFRDFIK